MFRTWTRAPGAAAVAALSGNFSAALAAGACSTSLSFKRSRALAGGCLLVFDFFQALGGLGGVGRGGIGLEELFVSRLRHLGVIQVNLLNLGDVEERVVAVAAVGILAAEELVGLDGLLPVLLAEPLAHLVVHLGGGRQGVGGPGAERGDVVDPPVAGHN